jgi:hypothetical protein
METADGTHFEKAFLGKCMGVGLRRRGDDDLHVMFTLLVEDDGNWYVSSGNISSHWFPELMEVLDEARHWLGEHCEHGQYGWAFRKKEPNSFDALIEAFQIFRKYGNPYSPTHCEHDVMQVQIEAEKVSDADKARLKVLGFETGDPTGCGDEMFYSFRFGSA